jgi:hypothetical protein
METPMFFISTACKIARVLGVIALAAFLTHCKTVAENAASPPLPEEAAKIKAWHKTMSRTPAPKTGCFEAAFPSPDWLEVPCGPPPKLPYPLAAGIPPETVGGKSGNFSAQVASGLISSAEGLFASVTGVTSITNNSPLARSNFALQLNTNLFTTGDCTSPVFLPGGPPSCAGWQQFIFSNSGIAYIQYWMVNYGADCPSASDWKTFKPTSSIPGAPGCYKSSQTVAVPVQDSASLAQLSLIGKTDGTNDTIIMSTATAKYMQSFPRVLDLSKSWIAAEFNIFGDCCSTQVTINGSPTIVVGIAVDNGTSTAPSILSSGFTAETNNLTLVSPACSFGGLISSISFMESNVAGATYTCASLKKPFIAPLIEFVLEN